MSGVDGLPPLPSNIGVAQDVGNKYGNSPEAQNDAVFAASIPSEQGGLFTESSQVNRDIHRLYEIAANKIDDINYTAAAAVDTSNLTEEQAEQQKRALLGRGSTGVTFAAYPDGTVGFNHVGDSAAIMFIYNDQGKVVEAGLINQFHAHNPVQTNVITNTISNHSLNQGKFTPDDMSGYYADSFNINDKIRAAHGTHAVIVAATDGIFDGVPGASQYGDEGWKELAENYQTRVNAYAQLLETHLQQHPSFDAQTFTNEMIEKTNQFGEYWRDNTSIGVMHFEEGKAIESPQIMVVADGVGRSGKQFSNIVTDTFRERVLDRSQEQEIEGDTIIPELESSPTLPPVEVESSQKAILASVPDKTPTSSHTVFHPGAHEEDQPDFSGQIRNTLRHLLESDVVTLEKGEFTITVGDAVSTEAVATLLYIDDNDISVTLDTTQAGKKLTIPVTALSPDIQEKHQAEYQLLHPPKEISLQTMRDSVSSLLEVEAGKINQDKITGGYAIVVQPSKDVSRLVDLGIDLKQVTYDFLPDHVNPVTKIVKIPSKALPDSLPELPPPVREVASPTILSTSPAITQSQGMER